MIKRAAPFAILLVAIIPALCPARSSALDAHDAKQAAAAAAGASSAPIPANEDSALKLLSIVLQLSDSQQEQARAAFDASVKTAAPIANQMENDKQALSAAVRSGKKEDEIKRLAELQGALTSQMLILQAQTFAKLWAILDERQRAQIDDFVYSNIRLFLPAFPQ